MRLPSFTTRRLMVLVAVVAMLLGAWVAIEQRSDHFLEIAQNHNMRVEGLYKGFTPPKGRGLLRFGPALKPVSERQRRLDEWDYTLELKYRHAARHPWLPVPPDPPMPE